MKNKILLLALLLSIFITMLSVSKSHAQSYYAPAMKIRDIKPATWSGQKLYPRRLSQRIKQYFFYNTKRREICKNVRSKQQRKISWMNYIR